MTTLEELRRCAEATTAHPETEAEDVLAAGALRLIAALEAVESQCAYWDTLAPGDKYYAARIRYAINEALGES